MDGNARMTICESTMIMKYAVHSKARAFQRRGSGVVGETGMLVVCSDTWR
jgi:hypothetical protein